MGVAENIADNAAGAIVPDLVTDEQVDEANSRNREQETDQRRSHELVGHELYSRTAASCRLRGGLYALAAVAFRLTPVMSRPESTEVEKRAVWVEAWGERAGCPPTPSSGCWSISALANSA